jgi:tripartite-type tricarboxylate transporter receptor subunit TctC
MPLKTKCYIILITGIAALAGQAHAQQPYPARPLRVVVPYTPGGITDVVTRIFAQEVSKAVNQNVLVDNRPGANSILGVDIVSKANADGYTLVSVIAAHAANQTLYPKLPYDSIKSFTPVSLLVTAPLIVCVTNALAARDAKELVALAKAKPGTLAFASSGIGAAAHLTTELLMLTTGIKMNHVPYKGTAPALQDLIGGQIQVMMDTPSSMLPHVRGGKIKALGMASEKRIQAAPDIPTLTETGVPVVGGTWVGWLAPAGTPKAAVEKLSAEIQTVGKRQEIRDRLIQMGNDPVAGSPSQFDQFLRDEVAKWGKVIKQAGVKVEG